MLARLWEKYLWFKLQGWSLAFQSKSMDWFLYDNGVRLERVNEAVMLFNLFSFLQINQYYTCF